MGDEFQEDLWRGISWDVSPKISFYALRYLMEYVHDRKCEEIF